VKSTTKQLLHADKACNYISRFPAAPGLTEQSHTALPQNSQVSSDFNKQCLSAILTQKNQTKTGL